MDIYLLRHFESEKNISNTLSKRDDPASLSDDGKIECKLFAKEFNHYCERQNIQFPRIDCTDSKRAIETSLIISQGLNNIPIKEYRSLESTHAGNLAGLHLTEINKIDSFFSKNYYLYRKGVYDLYNFDRFWQNESRETKEEFETRVITCFLDILKESTYSKLIISHRSTITAILLFVAREIGIYPKNFYGHIELGLGKLSKIRYNLKEWEILCLNEPIKNLSQYE